MADKFEYNYNAISQEERQIVESIKNQYIQKDNKISLLKKLDHIVKFYPKLFSIILGVIGILGFGLGLTFVLEWDNIICGIVISIIGIILMLLAFPLYNFLLKKLTNKYSNQIIDLSNEILNTND